MPLDPRLLRPVLLSIAASVVTLAMKAAASWVTGSVTLLSDAAESGVNLVASVTALFSLWYSSQPVDRSHTYGHEKIEYFSSGLEGLLIVAAALGIAWHAVTHIVAPPLLAFVGVGALVALVAGLINLAVGWWLLRVGKSRRSIVLEADGHHLMADVATSVASAVGLGLVAMTGFDVIDPLLALAVSANIAWTGGRLVARSFDGLMDHALPEAEQAVVRRAIDSRLDAGTAYHALRTRAAGPRKFADFHLLVPGGLSVAEAHALADRVEGAVQEALPGVEVTIHIEPIEAPASYADSAVLPVEEAERRPSP
jgi:cation diffusion facilitator family transporter